MFLPEACDYIASTKDEAKQFAEPLDGYLMQEYKKLAKSHNVWISIGGFHEKIDEVVFFYITFLYFQPCSFRIPGLIVM